MLAALLALALAADAAPPPPLEVLEAGTVDYDIATGRGVGRGGVVLRRGAVMLRAETATYDTNTGEVDAAGSVLLTEPGRAVAATRMHAVLDGPWAARDVIAYLKDTPLDLSTCRTTDEARGRGLNRLTLRGGEVTGESGAPGFEIAHSRITLCDCGAGPPSWEIRSHHADVVPGERAWLTWPVIYVTPRFLFIDQPVPVLALPALYLPLGERQTGLLFPVVSFGAVNGITQPFFITLGRSWDATVAAVYNFSQSAGTGPVTGPGANFELRWAPAEGTSGRLELSFVHTGTRDWPGGYALPPGGNRLALSGVHQQRFSDDTYLAATLGLVGDPLYVNDFTGDALLRATDYRRSAVALTHRTDDLLFEADAAYLLALTYLSSGNAAAPAPFGLFGADLKTFHRFPSASVSLLPTPVAGPVRAAGTLSVARFGPLYGATGDEGADGLGPGVRNWFTPDAGEGDGRWQGPGPGGPGERLAATRALARLELTAPQRWGALSVEPWAATTAAAYAFEAGPDPQADARLAGGLALSTELARTFGTGDGRVRHVIEPRVEWRGGTGQAGPGVPNYAYDEMDVALPARVVDAQGLVTPQRNLSAIPGAFSQLRLEVRNRLVAPAGALANTFLELAVGQDLDAASGRASETWAQGALRLPFLTVDAHAGFRAFGAAAPAGTPQPAATSVLDTFTDLSASATLFDRRGDNLHTTFTSLAAGASPRVVAGLEPFFDPRPVAADAVAIGSVGFAARWSGALIGYDAWYYGRQQAAPPCAGASVDPHIFQHQGSFTWDSPCHCWKAGVTVLKNECESAPRITFSIDLSSIASGTGGGLGR